MAPFVTQHTPPRLARVRARPGRRERARPHLLTATALTVLTVLATPALVAAAGGPEHRGTLLAAATTDALPAAAADPDEPDPDEPTRTGRVTSATRASSDRSRALSAAYDAAGNTEPDPDRGDDRDADRGDDRAGGTDTDRDTDRDTDTDRDDDVEQDDPDQDDRTPGSSPTGALTVTDDGFARGGERFFWLGDTAWSLLVNLDRDEVVRYLDTRAEQGFTVVQAVAIFPQAGGPGPNRYGDSPYGDGLDDLSVTDGADPDDEDQYDYWDHLDFVREQADARGMVLGLLPVWGDRQAGSLLTRDNAERYGRFLGERYGDADNLVWILGGDAPADGVEDVWRRLAGGLRAAGADQPATYHPRGDQTSVEWFAGDDWLGFHMFQGGHCLRYDVRAGLVAETRDAGLPFLDGEPIYEDHPYCWEPDRGFSTAQDVRRDAWWAVLGGAAGHTYGHHAMWQFLSDRRAPQLGARGSWTAALDADGANQMRHLRTVVEALPVLTAADDLLDDTRSGAERVSAAAADGVVVVYSGAGRTFSVDVSALSGTPTATWVDPRTGAQTPADTDPAGGDGARYTPPDRDDWVLVVRGG